MFSKLTEIFDAIQFCLERLESKERRVINIAKHFARTQLVKGQIGGHVKQFVDQNDEGFQSLPGDLLRDTGVSSTDFNTERGAYLNHRFNADIVKIYERAVINRIILLSDQNKPQQLTALVNKISYVSPHHTEGQTDISADILRL